MITLGLRPQHDCVDRPNAQFIFAFKAHLLEDQIHIKAVEREGVNVIEAIAPGFVLFARVTIFDSKKPGRWPPRQMRPKSTGRHWES
uniref:Uncharacterized protein n=1 Tax=Plectus sambesii TaxID=2011161 RepID=A0A914URF7_9BILA